MSDIYLTAVKRLPEEHAFLLTWDDGFEAKPSYRYLCGYCPCAGCQGYGGRIEYHEPPEDIEPAEINPVGNYAIHIVWKGGCRDGIYSFRFLRRLCSVAEDDKAPLDKDDLA
jgi:DUF971 family protein